MRRSTTGDSRRRDFLTRLALVGAAGLLLAQGTDWRFLNELKKELKS